MRNGEYILVIAPDDYPGKKYRGRYCYEHHLVYWQHHDIVPKKDELIHHIDGNKHHNVIENLELQLRTEHTAHHNRLEGRKHVLLKCPICNIVFERLHSKTHLSKKTRATCCSRQCGYKLSKIDDITSLLEGHVVKEYRKQTS